MSEQDSTQASTRPHRSRQTSKQSSIQVPAPLQRPASDDKETWKVYWKAQGQSWRTEPKIDADRQIFLTERRSITPNIEKGVYPFKDIESKLTRADIEWLLETHEDGRGPVDWHDEHQRARKGLDLRGADLRKVDLHGLPLAFMCGGLNEIEWIEATLEQRDIAGVHLEGADLRETHLEEAILCKAHLEGANLRETHLEGADLYRAYMEGAYLRKAHLGGTSLRKAFFDSSTSIDGAVFEDEKLGFALLADVHWGDINLSDVNWTQIKKLGDEYKAQQPISWNGKMKTKNQKFRGYQRAVRANRQLAVVLRDQGLNEEADHFAYRAQLLQRKVLWQQQNFGRWLFSMLLALLSGYGFRIWRILAAYVVVVLLFAVVYFVLGMYYPPHLPLLQAFLESITAFHGRVFSELFNSYTPQIWVTAFEAIAGLVIEGVFIAMLIQRFFGK